MHTYKIEYRIRTLAENAVNMDSEKPSFEVDGIKLEHWDFNHRDGWVVEAWLATAKIKANDYKKAYKIFMVKFARIVPRIAFVSQCFTETFGEPFLITREDTNIAFFGDYHETGHVGLMFLEDQKAALDKLLVKDIDDAFFFYWNDAINTIGYAAKLLVMFSAIEALAKKPNGVKDWEFIKEILGNELYNEIFEQRKGLRHRLTHGEYFSPQDSGKSNYVEIIHKKVILYFNNSVLKSNLLTENTISPQRHPFGNREYSHLFIRPNDDDFMLGLINVLTEVQSKPNAWPFDLVDPNQTADF